MNLEQFKKNVGYRVQLMPIACRLDENGRELPPVDGDWIIDAVSAAGVHISNQAGHSIILGKDHIHHFTSNPDRSQGGILYGFLVLNVQVFIQGNKCWIRPNIRPGEPVKPQVDEIADKWVDPKYPSDSGIQQRLGAAGYRVAWCLDSKLSRKIDLEGWETVVEPDIHGARTRFRLKDGPANQTLIKIKASNREQEKRVTNVKRCLECGQDLHLATRGPTTADTVWLCSNVNYPTNPRR